jgi:hypothetical protein
MAFWRFKMSRHITFFVTLLAVVGGAQAELIQHLDATVSGSVAGDPVTQWNDQSGKGNHALKKGGVVSYPSTNTFASGLPGLKFGPSYSSLTLFSSDSWLNQTSGNGFCVLVAFKVDLINTNGNSDVLGNDDAVNPGGLGLQYAPDGAMKTYLGGIVNTKSGQKITNGDTVVYAINYNPTTGIFEFWDSKNYDSLIDEINPANFSLGYPVTLGYSGHTGRFLNGLVGEVKIYNAALGADLFKAEREAMASKWASIANMSEIRWRVIPEDPDYPTDEVIMAAISVDDSGFANPLPADPANTDCTATFQEAIDTVSQANGGTVWVPEGEYRFDNNLILRGGVSLRGRWDRPSATNWNPGSVLKIYHGQDNPDGDAFITLSGGGNATIKELTFWHPNQSPTNIKPYPYVISAYTGLITPENLTFVNAYRGINQLEAGFGLIRGIYGTTLETGLMSDSGEAVPRFESLYAGPQYWEWWPLDNAVANPGQAGNYANFMLNSGTFFRIQNMDVFSFYNADISGYSVGFVMENSDGGSADNGAVPNHGQVSGVNIHDCKIAMHVKVGSFSTGMKSTFSGSQYGIYSSTDGDISLTECNISGGTYAAYNAGGSEFRLNAKSCTINGPVRFEDGTLELKACNFTSAGTHVTATSGIDRGVVWGCTYNNTQSVTIVGASYMNVDPTPLNYKPLPAYGINPLTDWNTGRKPAKTNLFNVVAYGAKGDGKTDDTTAVKAAISAAKLNGGGIVFFPFGAFGRYRITDNLDLGAGVELRGIGHRGPVGEYKSQSIIFVEKSGAADGTPFITMGDGSGMRGGLVFWYPANNWDRVINGGQDFIPYPYTIYAHGTNNYIIACTTPNAYQFADFDAAIDPLLDMMLTGGLHKVYRVRGGTTGCRIMTGHVKPSGMWGNLTDIPNNKANYTVFGGVTAKELEIFYLQECEDLTILGMFCRESQSIMTCNGAQGRVIGTAGEGVQNGFCFESAGATPLHLIDTKPNMSEQGDGTGKSGILVEPTFNGTLDMFGGAEQGAADYKFKVLSGTVHAQERKNVNSGWAQLRGVYVGGNANLTIYDNVLDKPFSLNVESNAVLKLDHSYFPSGIPYATIEGSLVLNKCDINENCIMSVPGQTQFSQHGLILDTNNTTRATNNWSYSQKLTSGDSFNLNVTESAFTNNKVKSVDFEIGIYLGASGSNTVSVYYDSGTGEKLGKTQTFTGLDGRVKVVSFSVSDARFNSPTNDIRIQVSNPAAAAGLSYIWVRGTPPLEPPFDLTAAAGVGSISLDWKGKSHWKFGSYSVYRSGTAGGPYTRIATNVIATAFTDTNVVFGSTNYYIVKTVDSSGNESAASSAVAGSLLVNPLPGTLQVSVSGATLGLSWPTNRGWILQSQTNALNVGLVAQSNAWFSLPGSALVTMTNLPIDKAKPTVFYRLIYP